MKKSILFLIESLAGGGAEKVLITLLNHLEDDYYNLTLCCVANVGKYLDLIPSHVHYQYLLPDYSSLSGISRLFYKLKYHLIYHWLPVRLIYKWFIPKGNEIEIAFIEGNATRILSGSLNKTAFKIAWVHIDIAHSHKKDTAIYNSYNQIITVSNGSKKAFLNTFPNVQTPISVIHNPIDRNEILRLAADNNDVPSKKENTIRLVSIGRLTEQKAFDRLLRIVHQLNKENLSLELWIIGEGNLRESLQEYIDKNHMERVVTLWGFQYNPYKYLSKSDLFVCSSLAEGFSTAATEAVILGLPVVTTDCSGMDELILKNECGIITQNNENALYYGLKSIVSDKASLLKYKQGALARSLDFQIELLMNPFYHLLQQ